MFKYENSLNCRFTIYLVPIKQPSTLLDIWIKAEKTQGLQKVNIWHSIWKPFFPPREEAKKSVLAAIDLADPETGKLFTDLTGRFPFTGNRGMQHMLILYAHGANTV